MREGREPEPGEHGQNMTKRVKIEVPGPEIFGESRTPMDEIPDTPDTHRFCPLSLGDWINACRRANVPHIPAAEGAVLYRHDVIRYEEGGEPHRRNLQAIRAAQRSCRPGEMLRLDCCAGSETKIRMATGQTEWHPRLQQIYVGDPHPTDLMLEMPRERIPIWRRPWISAKSIGAFPVEYRAYVQDGQTVGISNYHIQRPLPRNDAHIDAIGRYTDGLIRSLEPPFLWNYGPFRDYFDDHFDTDGVHFTADYIVDSQDNVIFLEGNPPHHLGAHPCCFQMDETYGLALAAPETPRWRKNRRTHRAAMPARKRRTRWKRAPAT